MGELYESKDIRTHRGEGKNFRHVGSLFNRKAARRLEKDLLRKNKNLGRSLTQLQAQFSVAIEKLLVQAEDDDLPSNRQIKAILRGFHQKAFIQGKKAAGDTRLLSQEDTRWLSAYIDKEWTFLKKFITDVEHGRSKFPQQRRKEMYVKTLVSTYDSARVIGLPENTVIDWVLGRKDAHCPQCKWLAKTGPYLKSNLPVVPRSGSTVCKSNCGCELKVRVVALAEYTHIRKRSKNRAQLQKAMRFALRRKS